MKEVSLFKPNLEDATFHNSPHLNLDSDLKVKSKKVKSKSKFKLKNGSDVGSSAIKNQSEKRSHDDYDDEDFFKKLRGYSLSELVSFKLEVFFHQQRKAQVKVDGLYDLVMEQIERPLIELSLKKFRGNQLRASKMLGINRNTLKRKIDFYKIKMGDIKELKTEKNVEWSFINH